MRTLARKAWRLGGRPGLALAQSLAMWLLASAAFAQGAVLTIVDGDAVLVDGVRRVAAAPGVRVNAGTLVETGPNTSLLRLEWNDRTMADLGPATKAMVQPPGLPGRGGKPALLYLLQGWAKLSAEGEGAGGLLTPGLDVLPFSGVAVVQARKPQGGVFAETGALEVQDRSAARRQAVPAGGWYGGRAEARPPADWLAQVPRGFRDTLPHRAALFKDRSVNAAPLPPPTYTMLSDWLAAEPLIRRDFPRRFEPLAQDAAFRRELQARLSAHPEWGRVLNPPERKP